MKRIINHIVIHCTATQPATKIESIQRYWRKKLGWKNPGYHYIIKRDGEVVALHPEDKVANGVRGHNKTSIHISYIGGIDKNGKPQDNRTPAQQAAMFDLIVELSDRHPKAEICGHRDFAGVHKACPSFDVKQWLAGYVPDIGMAG